MNWDDLRIFLAVARLRGVARAAVQLKLDPATVSRRVRRLEAQLGAALFARSPGGVVLTDAGERLQVQAEDMERIAANVTTAASGAEAGLRGTVRIGAPDGCANFLLPQICAALSAENPELCLDLVAMTGNFDVQRREVDIAVTVSEPGGKRMAVRHVAEYELVFAASPALLGGREGPDALRGKPLTGYIPELLLDPALDIPEEYGLADPMLRSSSVMVQFQWIRSGRAAGLLHDFALPMAPELVPLAPHLSMRRTYFLVSRRQEGQLVGEVLERLETALRAEMARLRAWKTHG